MAEIITFKPKPKDAASTWPEVKNPEPPCRYEDVYFGSDYVTILTLTAAQVLHQLNRYGYINLCENGEWQPEGISHIACSDRYVVVYCIDVDDECAPDTYVMETLKPPEMVLQRIAAVRAAEGL